VQVQLVTDDGIALTQDFSHDDGRVEFRMINEGRYRIRVSGSGFETTTTDPFTILHNEHLHNEIVYITPTQKAQPSSAQPLVSAYDLNVPEKAREHLEKAADAFAKGEVDKAIESIRKAIDIYPQYAQAYNNLGVALISKGDPTGAERAFADALNINDKFVPAMINVARMRFKTQNLVQAAELVQKSVALEPNNLEALALWANIAFYQGNYSDVTNAVNRIHALPHEGFAEAHLIAAEAYQKQEKNDQSLNECSLFLKEAPNSPRAEQVRRGMKVIASRK